MTFEQVVTLAVLILVLVGLISGKIRADVTALAAAAALTATGAVSIQDLQRGLASPALIALASLFILAEALDRTGVMGAVVRWAGALSERWGRASVPLLLGLCGAMSAFINNTPLVILAAPLMQETAQRMGWSPRQLLIPLSYVSILGGSCTLIGTSTNLLVDGVAREADLEPFTLFEISGVGLAIAAAGALYLLFVAPHLLPRSTDGEAPPVPIATPPLRPFPAMFSLVVFAFVLGAASGGLPIAVVGFAGAVVLLLSRVISPEEAYAGLRPQVLLMIGGMLVLGAALDRTGLAIQATEMVARLTLPLGPVWALAALYGATLLLTELMSNAAVAVLMTPLAIGLAQNLGVDPRPFVVGVMMAASAAFATPFGYQTNAIVYHLGGYRYSDFLRVGAPLNAISAVVAVAVIPHAFPF